MGMCYMNSAALNMAQNDITCEKERHEFPEWNYRWQLKYTSEREENEFHETARANKSKTWADETFIPTNPAVKRDARHRRQIPGEHSFSVLRRRFYRRLSLVCKSYSHPSSASGGLTLASYCEICILRGFCAAPTEKIPWWGEALCFNAASCQDALGTSRVGPLDTKLVKPQLETLFLHSCTAQHLS